LAGTIPLADPEQDTPWPVAALVADALLPELPDEPLPGTVLADAPLLAAGLLAGLAEDWLSAVLVAAVALACRAW
jgi:hypothetical protein